MTTPKQGHFVLHSSVMPPMTAGHYQLVTNQGEGGLPFGVAEERTHVIVSAPRFTMPPDQILSSFPPANGEGAYGDRLPQIVLKRRTLPWERNPAEVPAVSPTPWLALVVVAEGEAELSTATPVDQCVTPPRKLLDPEDRDVEQGLYLAATETVVRKIFPCEQDLPLLAHVREVDVTDTELANGDDDGWLAVVLANRLPVYDAVNDKPVRYMACLVSVEGQLNELPPPIPPADHFTFELAQDWTALATVTMSPDPRVMGGFDVRGVTLPDRGGFGAPGDGAPAAAFVAGGPKTGTSSVGVSLDGATVMAEHPTSKQWTTSSPSDTTAKVAAAALDPNAQYLVRDTMAAGFRLPIELIALERVLRFPVLAHWTFTTNGPVSFEYLMQNLDVGLLGTVEPTKLGDPPAAGPGPEVVETGHIGLNHRSRRGDPVRAWYRGPLVPFPSTRQQPVGGKLPLAHSADQLRRVVPDGREDLSLSAAFEIGRLLGLSQLSIVSALLRFRGEQFGAGRVHSILDHITDFEIPSLVGEYLDLGRYVSLQIVDGLAVNPTDTIGPRRPVADPGRPVELRGGLDTVIAKGLGLDLEQVQKMGDAVGIATALAVTDIPLGAPKGQLEFNETVISNLRSALSAEIDRVVGVSIGKDVIGNDVGPGPGPLGANAPVAPAGPDALDELIARADTQLDPEDQR